jgi:hypothetical protein
MLSIYYKIWADAIVYERSKKDRQSSWKAFTIIPVSILQGINLLAILLLIHLLSRRKYLVIFPMHIFNITGINTFLSVLLTYFVPFIIINYLLIFYNNHYQEVLKIYGDKKGKLYGTYAFVSIGVIVVPFLFKLIF